MTDHLPRKDQVSALLRRRYKAERRFKLYGQAAIAFALIFLGIMLVSIAIKALPAFTTTLIELEINFDPELIDPEGTRTPEAVSRADYQNVARRALRALFPEVTGRRERRELYALLSAGAGFDLREMVMENPDLIGTIEVFELPGSDTTDAYKTNAGAREMPEHRRLTSDRQIEWLDQLAAAGRLHNRFNTRFFTAGDSREPELAGIWGAVAGSFFTILVCLVLSFPLGVMTAVYLEEFAPRNWWTDLIEVNLNNLAAVPSIIFGLLGLALFLGVMNLPRSAPLVGGLVLTLMTLPTIIITARAALSAVPPSLRAAALGVGASPVQVVVHHVLPVAMPGILTGTIIGMARALGETAPLLMIGMVAFIIDAPAGITDPASTLPVQVYLWADSPERGFEAKASAAILVLLGFLITMNLAAVILRRKFEKVL